MIIHLKYFILIILFFIPLSIYAQEKTPFHSIFTIEDGLPSNRVYDIMQDSKGYIWAGTSNGLTRFNGQEFKEYTTVESINPEYSYLHELSDGSIWCINFGNQVLKVSGDSLKVVDIFKPYINDRKYFKLHKWGDDILYLENENRILEYHHSSNQIKEIEIHDDNNKISNFCRDEKNIFFTQSISSRRIYSSISLGNDSISFYDLKHVHWSKILQSNDHSFLHMKPNKKQAAYLSHFSPSSPYHIDKKNHILNLQGSDFNTISSITYLDEDNLWISTKKGSYNTPAKHIFPNNYITRTIKDQQGNYWLSTHNSGIFFIPNLNLNHFEQFKLSINQIKSISDSELIIGTTKGYIHIYNTKENKIRNSIFTDEYATKKLPLMNGNKNLYVNSNLSSYLLNLDNNQTSQSLNAFFPIKKQAIIGNNYFLFQLEKKQIGIYNTNTILSHVDAPFPLSKYWEKSKRCTDNTYPFFCGFVLSMQESNIENIHYEKEEERIWVAYTNKTYIEQHQSFKDFTDNNGEDLQLNCFVDYMDQGMIAAKRNHGLIFIKGDRITADIQHEKYEEFGAIQKIIIADSLIISLAKKGIIVSDKNGIPIHTLDETDGLKGSIINDIHFHSNQLWVGTSKGLYNIHINHFRDNLTAPNVYINNILINNKETNPASRGFSSFPNNSDVEINYEAISFKGRKKFHYEYKLNNNENWKTLSSSSNSIRFPNLSSGKYFFQIRAINEEGVKGNPSILNFKILPPFWLRWWFILSCLITIGLILFFYNKRNLERIEKENQFEKERIERENRLEKERIERENQLQQEIRSNKLSALQSRMNPHFIFNSLNSIQDFIIKLDKVGANEYLGIFSDLMRVYLSHSERDHIEIQEETEALQLYLKLEELRFGDIDIEFNIDDELQNMDIPIPPLFIQPYIENAFKHGLLHKEKDKKLVISFKLIDQQLLILIKDNGVGRAKVKEIQNKTYVKGLSYSTKANQTRLELLNHNRISNIKVNTIDLYQGLTPSGTLVEITIPLSD